MSVASASVPIVRPAKPIWSTRCRSRRPGSQPESRLPCSPDHYSTIVLFLQGRLPCHHAADAAGLVLGPERDARAVPLVGRRGVDRPHQHHPQCRTAGRRADAHALAGRPLPRRRTLLRGTPGAVDVESRLPAPRRRDRAAGGRRPHAARRLHRLACSSAAFPDEYLRRTTSVPWGRPSRPRCWRSSTRTEKPHDAPHPETGELDGRDTWRLVVPLDVKDDHLGFAREDAVFVLVDSTTGPGSSTPACPTCRTSPCRHRRRADRRPRRRLNHRPDPTYGDDRSLARLSRMTPRSSAATPPSAPRCAGFVT